MRFLRAFSRVFLGVVFIFSGFVKVVDPLGTMYKFIDYFNAMHLEFLTAIALPLAILLCVAELVLGIMLLFNLLPKLAAWGTLIFMAIFTPLTFWLAVWNPVSDCGCFGDALILTNWETFWKNIVILAFTILIFVERKNSKSYFNTFSQWALSIAFAAFSFGISFYCIKHLPIIDFRPYKIGKNIQQGMEIPESEKDNVDVYESVFIYEKDGTQKEFSLDNLPDSTWTFIDAEHNLIKKGYQPPIHDFSIMAVKTLQPEVSEVIAPDPYDAIYLYSYEGEIMEFLIDELPGPEWEYNDIRTEQSGLNPYYIELFYEDENGEIEMFTLFDRPDISYEFLYAEYYDPQMQADINGIGTEPDDITEIVLEDDSYTFLLVSVFVEDAKTKNQERINELAAYCDQMGYRFICLTGSTAGPIEDFIKTNGPTYQFYNTDPVTLETIVRANPGLVLLKKGTILNKWAHSDIPSVDELQKDLIAYSISDLQKKSDNRLIWLFIFGSLLFFVIITMFYQWLKAQKIIS
jgi:uncharacterized membrane protein YphA (DoxX/SURF4 family)